ncbi:hypothetical protein ACFL52_00315 [Candidatus Margulisiibacteriota bacterium]
MEEESFQLIPAYFIEAHIDGAVLDIRNLRGMRIFYNRFIHALMKREGAARHEMPFSSIKFGDLVLQLNSLFDRLGSIPNSTHKQLLDLLIDSVRIGQFSCVPFLNIRILEGVRENDKWMGELLHTSTNWGPSKYEQKSTAETTLKSILEWEPINKPVKVWQIDMADPKSFEKEGLVVDSKSLQNDMEKTYGPKDLFIIRIALDESSHRLVIYKHNLVSAGVKEIPPSFIPETGLERREFDVQVNRLYYNFARNWRAISESGSVEARIQAPFQKAPAVLRIAPDIDENTLLYKGNNPPRNAEESHNLMSKILDEKGKFPGDSDKLYFGNMYERTFSLAGKHTGAEHFPLTRKGEDFYGEIITPSLYLGKRNGIIFVIDLIIQSAGSIYKSGRVSYPKRQYYEERFYLSKMVPIIRYQGQEISFAAISEYTAKLPPEYQEQAIYYAFIHFVMTIPEFQRFGLTSHSIIKGMSSLFALYLRSSQNRGYLINKKGKLKRNRWQMWAACHTGKALAYSGFQRFGAVPEDSHPIARAIIEDAHRKIYRESRRGALEFLEGTPYARDIGCYLENARYRIDGDQVRFSPQEETHVNQAVMDEFLLNIGGVEGLKRGNGLHLTGLVGRGGINKAKSREKERDEKDWGTRFAKWVKRRAGK